MVDTKEKPDENELRQILEDNALGEAQIIDRLIVKDLYVFRMAMARQHMPGARTTALNAATRLLDKLENHFGS